jgi:hypothetical protein
LASRAQLALQSAQGLGVMIMNLRLALGTFALLFAAIAPAWSADQTFLAFLHGDSPTTNTGSTAQGEGKLVVHDATQSVDLTLTVHGIAMKDLSEHLSHAPVGPVHLHIYAANGDSSLLLPFPMGANYAAAGDGFVLTVKNYPYADGAKIIASDITFDKFVAALQSGKVVLNIHTQKFADGEISGPVEAVH